MRLTEFRRYVLGFVAVVILGTTTVYADSEGAPTGGGSPTSPSADYDIVLEGVPLVQGTADINVRVFVNEEARGKGKAMFAIHGLAHTAESWRPFADTLFEYDDKTFSKVSQVVAIDLPGHGRSRFPEGVAYGDLFLEDYVAALLGTLDRLSDMKLKIRTIVAHSMGGLLVQMMQNDLVASGTNLKKEFKIRQAVLLAPAIPDELPWGLADTGLAAALIGDLVMFDLDRPDLGYFVDLPNKEWPWYFFTTAPPDPTDPASWLATLVLGTPKPREVAVYNAIEPLLSSTQLVGGMLPDGTQFDRPSVAPGIFEQKKGTWLSCVVFEKDWFNTEQELSDLYSYLTGDVHEKRFVRVSGPETPHDTYVSDPWSLLEALEELRPRF